MDLGRIVRAGTWAVAGVLGSALAAYLAFVAINWKDEPPSDDAVRMATSLRDRVGVDDESNAFVHLLGLAAPPDVDPLALGRERKASIDAFDAGPGLHAATDLPGVDADYRARRPRDVSDLASACPGSDCADAARANPDVLDRWIESERWLLERYRRMVVDTRAWRETVPAGPHAPLVGFTPALDAQALHLLDAHRHAVDGEAARVHDLLERDLAFWRGVLAASDTVLSKMIAVAAVERHLELGGMALRALPIDSLRGAVPPSWHAPLSDAERSLSRALAGEWRYSVALLAATGAPEALAGWDHVSARLLRPGFQPQATANLFAAGMSRWVAASERPYPELGSALETARGQAGDRDGFALYNPIGTLLHAVDATSAADYVARASDVEGKRRAALLAVTLRAAGVEPAGAEAGVRDADLRNPYSGAPFGWDATRDSIVFQGLARGERGRFAAPL